MPIGCLKIMRPALQRLLSRPSSLELLECLIETPGSTCAPTTPRHVRSRRKKISGIRGYGTVSLESRNAVPESPAAKYVPHKAIGSTSPSVTIIRTPTEGWHEGLFNQEQLEFESDLESKPGKRKRLLDQRRHGNDMDLWACLLLYRKRIYGDSGTLSFWNAIRKRSLILPTALSERRKGNASVFWPLFLELGFKNHIILEQIVEYADDLVKNHEKQWVKLYVSIVDRFLRIGDGENALKWHQRLLPLHPPEEKAFARMCLEVATFNGDKRTLKKIYRDLPHRKVYSYVIPSLITKEKFKDAYHWHLFFIENGDLPPTFKILEPLMHYLAIYDRLAALKVSKSLVNSGVSFVSNLPKDLEDNTKISREMMNLIHGKTFNVSEKKYNDNLGARWFATRWVSLDIAINTVHALGVQEIGPLSLQAICQRDSDAKAIMLRIQQLRDLGISIGNSIFARAVEHFAQNQKIEFLEGLLSSDQHPDQLEDSKLQEEILSESARLQDWRRYQRTLEIRSLASKSPRVEKYNIVLRTLVATRDATAVRDYLKQMQNEKIPVKATTCAHILRSILQVRQRGRRPMVPFKRPTKGQDDLKEGIEILQAIMASGSYVPVTLWREIIRRLGMLGRLDDLRKTCLFLAHWYGTSSPHLPKAFRIPVDVPTSHPLHPLKILFNESLQRAIIEWGFIHSLTQDHQYRSTKLKSLQLYKPAPSLDISFGITLLKQLNFHGVHIDSQSVRKALLHRLVIYYGPGTSNKTYNRIGQARMRGNLEVVAKQMDDALGGEFFTAVNLPKLVAELAAQKLEALNRRRKNKITAQTYGAPA